MEEKPARCTVCGDIDGDLHNTNPVAAPPHKFTTEGERQMYRIIVSDTLQRTTEVAVTSEQYATLHQIEDQVGLESATRFVLDEAYRLKSDENLEWICTIATDEDDEEVLDI